MPVKIRYNAPVVLSFSLAATAVMILTSVGGDRVRWFFLVPGRMNWGDPVAYLQLFTHVLGHGSWQHLLSNLLVILLIGPLLEEKYGHARLGMMVLITAFVTGVLNILLFNTGLLGASGVAFMLIVLSSLVNVRRGELPLTFVLVVLLFVGAEVAAAARNDSVSQFAHIVGGACGAAFGLRGRK